VQHSIINLTVLYFYDALIIDEAHSSQGGRTAAAMNEALSDPEDTVNDALEKRMQARKMLSNASYFAFTATPKNKTLELFGEPYKEGGQIKHRPFHSYTMKQAIQENFILDVLSYYTPVNSYYKLIKTVKATPNSIPKGRRRSFAGTSKAMITLSSSKLRSWLITSRSR